MMTNEATAKKIEETKEIYTIVPAVDIHESADSYTVALDVPGSIKEKIKAEVHENILTVTAAAPSHCSCGDNAEVNYKREFTLAGDIDSNSVEAGFDLGVLTITLKKKPQFLPKEILIR